MRRIYLSPPDMCGKELDFIRDAFESNWIAPYGPHVDAFEREFAAAVGVPYSAALSSGTAALHLALRILGTGDGGQGTGVGRGTKDDVRGNEVLCSTFTFAASANAIAYEGAVPVFIDSDARSWNMDPGLLREELEACAARGKLPRAVVVVDLYGQCADYDPIVAACEEFQVPLIEDAAEALGAEYWGQAGAKAKAEVDPEGAEDEVRSQKLEARRQNAAIGRELPVSSSQFACLTRNHEQRTKNARFAGSFGAAAAFSFNGNKILTTAGGGMLVSHDRTIIDRVRFLATQARDSAPHYQHSEIGFNYRMSNILAAIGRGQLTVLSERVAARRRNFEFYQQALQDLPGIEFMPEAPFGRCTRWLTCLTIGEAEAKAEKGRDHSTSTCPSPTVLALIHALEKENIEARPLWKPMHLQPVFKGCRVRGGGVSELLFENGLCLPSGSALTGEDLERICGVVRRAARAVCRSGRHGTGELLPCEPVRTDTRTREPFLPFAPPDVDEVEVAEVASVIRAGWLTSGPKTTQFESEFAACVGAKYAVAVNSCTAAMHLALEAIGLTTGDEVIVPTYTFAATAEVVRYFGARPVLVDVDPVSLCIDPAKVEAAITPRTRAIIPVHVAGRCAEMDEISAVAARHDLRVIEDAAHAFPAKYKGRMVGSISGFTCFSFYATKTITTGEGGMICTENEKWADRCRVMRLHGISHQAWNRYTAEGSWYYEIAAPGFKYNMTDIAAAIGLVQLHKAGRMHERRVQIARRYTAAFRPLPELEPAPEAPAQDQHAWHLYALRLNLDSLTIGRARFFDELKARKIGASVHFIPLHLHPYYRETYGYKPDDFPIAFREYQREISLPIYSKMTDGDVQDVIDAVTEIARQYRR